MFYWPKGWTQVISSLRPATPHHKPNAISLRAVRKPSSREQVVRQNRTSPHCWAMSLVRIQWTRVPPTPAERLRLTIRGGLAPRRHRTDHAKRPGGLAPTCGLTGCGDAQPIPPCKGPLNSGAHLLPVRPLTSRTIHGLLKGSAVAEAIAPTSHNRLKLLRTSALMVKRSSRRPATPQAQADVPSWASCSELRVDARPQPSVWRNYDDGAGKRHKLRQQAVSRHAVHESIDRLSGPLQR